MFRVPSVKLFFEKIMVDVSSIILQYLKPNGRDIVNVKLVCSHFKQMVEKVVPLHHIIFILQSIFNNEQNIPALVLPSNFEFKLSCFRAYFITVHQQMQQEDYVHHLVTKFILLFHNNPLIIPFLKLPHNSSFLFQLTEEELYPASPLFQQLQAMNRLRCIFIQSEKQCEETNSMYYTVNDSWIKEKEWSAAFLNPETILDDAFVRSIDIPDDKRLLNGIIDNKDLMLFLLHMYPLSVRTTLVRFLLNHPKWKEYKIELRVEHILFKCSYGVEEIIKMLVQEFSLSECQDEPFIKRILQCNGELLQYLSPEMKKKKRVVMTAIKNRYTAFRFAASEVQMDKDIIREVNKHGRYRRTELMQIAKHYEKDEKFSRELLLPDPNSLNEVSYPWLQFKEEALAAASTGRHRYSDMLHRYWSNDRDVMLAAVNAEGKSIKYASDDLRNDEEIVIAAIQESPTAIEYASKFKGNKTILLRAMRYEGYAIQYFDAIFRDDMECILESVKTISSCFLNASARIKQDYSCVKQIVKANGYCFKYLSKELQEDEILLQIALQSNPMILEVLPKEIRDKKEVMQIAKHFYGIEDY